ncbi:MAG: hypothetical protein ABIP42_11705, partial [Planctomycetota bacterium]
MTSARISKRSIAGLASRLARAALLRICVLLGAAGLAWAQTDPPAPPKPPPTTQQHAARGFGTDSARVDSQITLKIPTARADEVYEYLKSRYVGRSDILAEQFPGHHLHGQAMSDLSIFTDRYFDTP